MDDALARSGLPEQYAPIVMRTVREAIVEARDAALEEAALECDAQMVMSDRPRTPRDAAIAIRVLKSKTLGSRADAVPPGNPTARHP